MKNIVLWYKKLQILEVLRLLYYWELKIDKNKYYYYFYNFYSL